MLNLIVKKPLAQNSIVHFIVAFGAKTRIKRETTFSVLHNFYNSNCSLPFLYNMVFPILDFKRRIKRIIKAFRFHFMQGGMLQAHFVKIIVLECEDKAEYLTIYAMQQLGSMM